MAQLSPRVAVITGSNKGIGFAIVRALCKRLENGIVYLTARSEERGREAVAKLNQEGLQPKFHQLDVTDQASIDLLRDYLKETHGGLDILVNNAGIACNEFHPPPAEDQHGAIASSTMATNFTGNLNVCRALIPLVRPRGRVVNIASLAGVFVFKSASEEIQARFQTIKTEQDVEILMKEFVEAATEGAFGSKGWPKYAYGISKTDLTAVTKVLAEKVERDRPDDGILVVACCPGMVKTEMTRGFGRKTIDEGTDTPVFLALLPPETTGFGGKMFSERMPVDDVFTRRPREPLAEVVRSMRERLLGSD